MKISAVVALTLLETIRAQDLPSEVLEQEDPSVTLPRRLGLSEVIDKQIRAYREEARKRHKISDEEAKDLFQLVLRRPDAEDIFFQAGELLAGRDVPRGGVARIYPRRLQYALARRQVRKRLKALFGRSMGGFGKGLFSFEGRSLLFIKNDPGGDACEMVSGFCQAILRRHLRRPVVVFHSFCQARNDPFCRWTAHEEEPLTFHRDSGDVAEEVSASPPDEITEEAVGAPPPAGATKDGEDDHPE